MLDLFGFLAPLLGILMEWIYHFTQNYGVTIVLFTLIIKVLLFPLMMKQQKSSARMAVYQPMMNEIREKWAKDKQRQNEELMKFQEEAGISMTAGCLPMLLNMLVLFGLIRVVYYPIQFILRVPADAIKSAMEFAGLQANNIAAQSNLINIVKADPETYRQFFGDATQSIVDFNFNFFGIDLSQVPQLAFDVALILPIIACVTMIVSQVLMMKSAGSQQMGGSMNAMMWVMNLMFAWFTFTVPFGFSLYYAVSNVLSLVQTLVLRKVYDPEEMKKQVEAEIAAKRAEKKKKKQVTIKTEDGTEVTKDVNDAELARIRLERARQLEAAKYDE